MAPSRYSSFSSTHFTQCLRHSSNICWNPFCTKCLKAVSAAPNDSKQWPLSSLLPVENRSARNHSYTMRSQKILNTLHYVRAYIIEVQLPLTIMIMWLLSRGVHHNNQLQDFNLPIPIDWPFGTCVYISPSRSKNAVAGVSGQSINSALFLSLLNSLYQWQILACDMADSY